MHRAVRDRLARLDPLPGNELTAKVILNLVNQFVDRHREQQEADHIIIEALDLGLPPGARANWRDGEPTPWQLKFHQTIATRLGTGDHPLDTIRRVVKQTVKDVTREFEEQERDRKAEAADAELRQRVKSEGRIYSIPWGLSAGERELAGEAVNGAVDALPPGTQEHELNAAVDEAMRPLRAGLAERAEQTRRAAEEARQKRSADEALARQKRETELAAEEKQGQAQQRRYAAERRVDNLLPVSVQNCLRKLKRPDDLATQWRVRDAIRERAVIWAATIRNLSSVTDVTIAREIELAARDYIERHLPRRVA